MTTQTRNLLEFCAKALLLLVTLAALAYCVAVARTTDISFDGAIFLQPVVSLERYGSLTHTYDVESPDGFHIPLTNLGQGMLSQYILNWPVIHWFGINHFTLQFSNLVFLALTAGVICVLIVRMTRNWPLALIGVILFFSVPELRALGLEGHGEVAGAFYLLLCAVVLRQALTGSSRYFYLLGFTVFLAFHTKNYLGVVFPLLLLLLGYLSFRQRAVRVRDIVRYTASFIIPLACLPLVLVLQAGWNVLIQELSRYQVLINSTQWNENAVFEPRSWSFFWEAIQVLGTAYGGWFFFYLPLLVTYFLAGVAVLTPGNPAVDASSSATMVSRLKRRLPRLDPDQAVILFISGVSFLYIGYWFHFSTWTIWYRRAFPFLIVNIPLLLIVIHQAWERWPRRRLVRRLIASCGVLVILLLGWSHVASFVKAFHASSQYDGYLAERIQASEAVRRLPKDAPVFGVGWWQAPKISLFAGRPFLDLNTKGEKYREGYLVLDREAIGMEPTGMQRVLSTVNAELVWENGSNKIYRWRQGAASDVQANTEQRIELWQIGPAKARSNGDGFYAMPDKSYAMWARTRFATPSSVLMWGDTPLKSSVQPDGLLMTAVVPPYLFRQAGRHPIWVYDKATKSRSGSTTLVIESN